MLGGIMKDSIKYKKIENIAEINEVVSLQVEIWGREVVSPQPQLVASIHHGGLIIGAFSDEKIVGFCYGFAGFKGGETYLISHMTGLRKEYQNLGIGYHLKLEQRNWANEYGYRKIVWTYDPLEIRNGYFNLCKLGAYAKRYYPTYYGEMSDKLNKGLPTDRLLVEWDIASNRVRKAINGNRTPEVEADIEVILSHKGEYPVRMNSRINEENSSFLVAVPTNIQEIKSTSPKAAMEWRLVLRDVLTEALSKGYRISGVQRQSEADYHYYILENTDLEDFND
jgi:predicted GNAT superfamily acetyltransferase